MDIVLIVIYDDDLIIIRDNDADICDVKLLLKQKFEMDFGGLQYFLGIEVIRYQVAYGYCKDNIDWMCYLSMG